MCRQTITPMQTGRETRVCVYYIVNLLTNQSVRVCVRREEVHSGCEC